MCTHAHKWITEDNLWESAFTTWISGIKPGWSLAASTLTRWAISLTSFLFTWPRMLPFIQLKRERVNYQLTSHIEISWNLANPTSLIGTIWESAIRCNHAHLPLVIKSWHQSASLTLHFPLPASSLHSFWSCFCEKLLLTMGSVKKENRHLLSRNSFLRINREKKDLI